MFESNLVNGAVLGLLFSNLGTAGALFYMWRSNRRFRARAEKNRRLRSSSRDRRAIELHELRSQVEQWRSKFVEADRLRAVHEASAVLGAEALKEALEDKAKLRTAHEAAALSASGALKEALDDKAQLRVEITSARTSIEILQSGNSKLIEEVDGLKQEFNDQRDEISDLTEEVGTATDLNESLQKELRLMRDRYRDLGTSFAEARNDRELVRLARQAASEMEHFAGEVSADPRKR
jgi:chromosome segregation ATPase